jgi:putative endopeptidase
MNRLWLGAAAASALLSAVPALAQTPAATPMADPTKAQRMGTWGFDASGRDMSVTPGQDFFEYANGTYVKALEIPADRTRYGAFDRLNELSQNRLHVVVDKASADKTAAGDVGKVGALYRSFMDEKAVNALGAKPLAPELARIKAAKTRAELAHIQGTTQHSFGGAFFGAGVSEDANDPNHYAVYIGQAGLGLPNRDYYLEASFAPQKAKYQAYVAQILTLEGWPNPAASAKAIVDMETAIAKSSWSMAEQRDPQKTYNPTPVADLAKLAPGYDWAAYLQGAGLTKATTVVVQEKSAFPQIAAIYAKTPIETLKAWQAFNLGDQAAAYLSKPFDDAHWEFRSHVLSGAKAQQPRWKRGVALVDNQVGESLGKLYVDAYFPAESKAKMEALVGDIRTAMHDRIEHVSWMSPETKTKAEQKLAGFRVKIGYPDKWRDYSKLAIKDGDLYGNVQRAVDFEWNYRVNRLGGPVDKSEWGMTPPTINAYYNPTGNEIVFPAAILQPPFFDPDGDAAINYGAIGGVIGHEMTHGFDDQGRQYDGAGRLTDWWTAADAEKFKVQAAKLGKQYDTFEVLPGAHIKGDQTMGENIADLGGLLLALDAYHTSLHGKPAPVIDGMTGDQRVFLGWAQVWRAKTREDRLRQQLVSDPHSPERARVDVPMRNIDAFYDAFGVKPGDAMYVKPEDRARIW